MQVLLNGLILKNLNQTTSNIETNEREITGLLDYFSKRVQYIFAVYRKLVINERNITSLLDNKH